MSVVGIDIGLKTLSICVISNSKKILLWDVYNILDQEDIKCQACGRKAKYKQGFCGTHYKGTVKDVIKKKKIKSYSKQDICKKLLQFVQKLTQENKDVFENVSKVILELQPSINRSMCFASDVIFSKFCDYYLDSKTEIKFERAKLKLKECKGPYLKNTYKNRKLKSIEHVKNLLQEFGCEKYKEFFNLLKKQDDASDSYLLSYNSVIFL